MRFLNFVDLHKKLFVGISFLCCSGLAIAQSTPDQVESTHESTQEKSTPVPADATATPSGEKWTSVFDEAFSLFEKTNFGGEGDIEFRGAFEDRKHVAIMEFGDPMTGLTFKDDFPKENFEIAWSANRLDGSDFLAGVTFPVGDEFCSYICGGWGGGLAGLSSIDGNDASENSTSEWLSIDNNRWYDFRIRVDEEYITVWMDGEEQVKCRRAGKEFSVRAEVRICRPFGYCAFQSRVAVSDLRFRTFAPAPHN